MAEEFPGRYERLRAESVPFSFSFLGLPSGGMSAAPEFYLVQGLTLLLLLVACANVGMLIFARTATRSVEMAVRTALGASRGRIVGQVFGESLVLAVAAAGMGLVILNALPRLLPTSIALALPYWLELGVTRETVLLALSLAVQEAHFTQTSSSPDVNLRFERSLRPESLVPNAQPRLETNLSCRQSDGRVRRLSHWL